MTISGSGPRSARWIRVAVIRQGRRYLPVDIDRTTTTIGRSLTCDIPFADDTDAVSRQQAEIRITGGGVVFRDLSSTNGTYLHGQRIDEVRLEYGREYIFAFGIVEHDAGVAVTAYDRPEDPVAPRRTIVQPVWERAGAKVPVRVTEPWRTAPPASTGSRHRAATVTTVSAVPATRVFIPEREAYRPAHVVQTRQPDQCYASTHRDELEKLCQLVMDEEAPISVDLLARRVAPYWGLARSSEKLRQTVLAAVMAGPEAKRPTLHGEFLWPAGVHPSGLSFFRVPTADERSRRRPDDVPLEEFANAAVFVLQLGALKELVLLQRTAALLGFSRLGSNVRARVATLVPLLVNQRRAVRSGEIVSLP